MFDPRGVFKNDRRYSHKAQIIQKRPITSEQNVKRPVHPSDLERAKVVMDTYKYSWYAFQPVLKITLKPKGALQPLFVDGIDPFIKDLNLSYWDIQEPEFYRGIYQVVLFIRAYNVYITNTNVETTLIYLLESYQRYGNPDQQVPGYASFQIWKKNQSTSSIGPTNILCPYTDTTYTTWRLCQSADSDEYQSVVEAIAIAY